MLGEPGDYVKASLDLAKELSERGARGEKLTDAEKTFVKQTARTLIVAIVQAHKRKTEKVESGAGVH